MVHIYKKKNKENKMLHGTLYTKKKEEIACYFHGHVGPVG